MNHYLSYDEKTALLSHLRSATARMNTAIEAGFKGKTAEERQAHFEMWAYYRAVADETKGQLIRWG